MYYRACMGAVNSADFSDKMGIGMHQPITGLQWFSACRVPRAEDRSQEGTPMPILPPSQRYWHQVMPTIGQV
jgi:hypothetical protein